jgi:hypothetical protein
MVDGFREVMPDDRHLDHASTDRPKQPLRGSAEGRGVLRCPLLER